MGEIPGQAQPGPGRRDRECGAAGPGEDGYGGGSIWAMRATGTGNRPKDVQRDVRCTSDTKKCGDSWACPSNLHDRYPIWGRQHERRLKAGAAAFPRKPLGDRRFRAFAVRDENSSNGRARFCAPRVVLRFEGPENGFGTLSGLNRALALEMDRNSTRGRWQSRSGRVAPLKGDEMRGPDGAADIHRSQTRSQVLRTY